MHPIIHAPQSLTHTIGMQRGSTHAHTCTHIHTNLSYEGIIKELVRLVEDQPLHPESAREKDAKNGRKEERKEGRRGGM